MLTVSKRISLASTSVIYHRPRSEMESSALILKRFKESNIRYVKLIEDGEDNVLKAKLL